MVYQPRRQPLAGSRVDVVQGQPVHASRRQRGRNGRPHAATPHHQRRMTRRIDSPGAQAAHEALPIEHVPLQPAVGPASHRIAGPGNLRRGRHPVQQPAGAHLVRHGDQRPHHILCREERPQQRRIAVWLRGKGYHHHIEARRLKVRVVDQRCLEGLGGITDMRDEPGVAADVHRCPR